MQAALSRQVKCIYIDPPYNTASSCDSLQEQLSALSLVHDDAGPPRLRCIRSETDGAIFVSIDKTERTVLEHVLDEVFGPSNRIEELIWTHEHQQQSAAKLLDEPRVCEVYARTVHGRTDRSMFREPKPGFEEVMALVALESRVSTNRDDREEFEACTRSTRLTIARRLRHRG